MNNPDNENTQALVLFSGGQDSTVCLAWALQRFPHVETIGFDYRQRHSVELECRANIRSELSTKFPDWAQRLGPDHMLDTGLIADLGETALTADAKIEFTTTGLPNTFVPGRNLLFFTLAAALAYRRSITHLVGGMCETDFSGYPDCRNDTLKTLEKALRLGLDKELIIETPLMWRDKADTFALAHELGGTALHEIILEHSHTCYLGDRSQRHEWGYGCGTCPACDLRKSGYTKYIANKRN